MMRNPKVKVGDKIKIQFYEKKDHPLDVLFVGDILTVTEISEYDGLFWGSKNGGSFPFCVYMDEDRYSLICDEALDNISNIIDESVWYGEPTPYPKSKPAQALGALIKVLVDKGLVTEDDFRNVLLSNNNNVGEPVLADAQPSNKND